MALKFVDIVVNPKIFIKKLFSQNYFLIYACIVVEMLAQIDVKTVYCMCMARRKFVAAA